MCFKLRKHMCNFLASFLASLYWLFRRFLDFSCLREWTKIKLSGTENAHRNRFPFTLCICLDVPLLKAVNIILFYVIDYYWRQEINHIIYFCTGWESNFDLSLWKQSCFQDNLAQSRNLVNLEEGNITQVIHIRFLKVYFLEYWVI